MPDNSLRPAAYAYLYGVITIGSIAVAYSAYTVAIDAVPPQWLVLAALTLLTGSFSVKIPSVSARMSVSDAFVFTAVLLYGPAPGTLIVALDSLVLSMWQKPDARHRLRSAFNFAAVSLSLWLSASLFFALVGAAPGRVEQLVPLAHLFQLFAFACVYFLLNSWSVAVALAFERNATPLAVWKEHFRWFIVNYLGGVSVAALLVSYSKSVDLNAVGIILPLLLISYLTYRTSLGRIADAKRHVDQLSAMYLSTIEALAMAVDAKDQITHGHIRRVQVYAMELAKRLGVRDEQQLKALEAAALLHDMGKLAIPEHILNKPGRLTDSEFERMKQHASLGADLLSSINFPYPVVPIVRHHHENWDGGGYPSSISGTDIPLGARILSVVDCFDALTSDRPYRPRLSATEAFQILRERRGSMYDPLIVDTFVESYSEIAPLAQKAGDDARSLLVSELAETTPLAAITATTVETSVLGEGRHAVRQARSDKEALEAAALTLRQLTPATTFTLHVSDARADSLVVRFSVGDPDHLLPGLVVPVGRRVSGWCAANLRSTLNSSATLELGSLADRFSPRLQSTLAMPLVHGGQLIGVITGFSPRSESFDQSHAYAFEQVAATLAERLALVVDARVKTFPLRITTNPG